MGFALFNPCNPCCGCDPTIDYIPTCASGTFGGYNGMPWYVYESLPEILSWIAKDSFPNNSISQIIEINDFFPSDNSNWNGFEYTFTTPSITKASVQTTLYDVIASSVGFDENKQSISWQINPVCFGAANIVIGSNWQPGAPCWWNIDTGNYPVTINYDASYWINVANVEFASVNIINQNPTFIVNRPLGFPYTSPYVSDLQLIYSFVTIGGISGYQYMSAGFPLGSCTSTDFVIYGSLPCETDYGDTVEWPGQANTIPCFREGLNIFDVFVLPSGSYGAGSITSLDGYSCPGSVSATNNLSGLVPNTMGQFVTVLGTTTLQATQ
jgi:hypothetical protein